jgi:large subunit ribosomal protein L2
MFFNIKKILTGKKRTSGRMNSGGITCWHRGGAHKRSYRFVDFYRREDGFFYVVAGYEYDPTRQGFLAILRGKWNKRDFFKRVLLPKKLDCNTIVSNFSSGALSYSVGSSYYLNDIPTGSFVHNLESKPFKGGRFIRSAGCFGQVIQKTKAILVKLPSGKLLNFHPQVRCSFGVLANENKKLIVIGTAGRNRWLGRRPIVRGVAMNPVDHPHGGGEGKSQIGRHPVTPWGRLTKGKKTK